MNADSTCDEDAHGEQGSSEENGADRIAQAGGVLTGMIGTSLHKLPSQRPRARSDVANDAEFRSPVEINQFHDISEPVRELVEA